MANHELTFIRYVLGFVFDRDLDRVALIRKTKPKFLRGKLTGLGGKSEAGEKMVEAIRREVYEEGGVDIPEGDWQLLGHEWGEAYLLAVYAACIEDLDRLSTQEDEEVVILPVKEALYHPAAGPGLEVHLELSLKALKER